MTEALVMILYAFIGSLCLLVAGYVALVYLLLRLVQKHARW